MIVPHILKKGLVLPHEFYYAGNDGIIDIVQFFEAGMERVNFTFTTIQCANSCPESPYNISEYVYILHVTTNKELLGAIGKCDLDRS